MMDISIWMLYTVNGFAIDSVASYPRSCSCVFYWHVVCVAGRHPLSAVLVLSRAGHCSQRFILNLAAGYSEI